MPVVVPGTGLFWWANSTTADWANSTTAGSLVMNMNIATTTTGPIYYNWDHAVRDGANRWVPAPAPPPASVARARREADLRAAERVALRESARDRARATLLSLLTAEQRSQFERGLGFEVVGSGGGRYRIDRGYQQNIVDLGARPGELHVLCTHPNMRVEGGNLPTEDAMIAQLLMIRFDEPGFLAVANRW